MNEKIEELRNILLAARLKGEVTEEDWHEVFMLVGALRENAHEIERIIGRHQWDS